MLASTLRICVFFYLDSSFDKSHLKFDYILWRKNVVVPGEDCWSEKDKEDLDSADKYFLFT